MQPQSFDSFFGGLGATPAPAASSSDLISPFGFSRADVSGFDAGGGSAPAAPAAPAEGGGDGRGVDFGGSGFDPESAERAYLATQVRQNNAMQAAGQTAAANNPNVWNQQLFALTPPAPDPRSFIPQTPAFAGVPTAPGFSAPGFTAPPPVLPQINIPNISAAGISNIGFGSLGIR